MISESNLKEQYISQIPYLEAWGEFVISHIKDNLKRVLPSEEVAESFLKVPVNTRVKNLESFISKALHRNKGYGDPINDITDKVGIRFVVLLLRDLEIIKKIIESSTEWDWSLDRDFENERLEKPLEFSYQSIHYIVRAKSDLMYNGKKIPKNTPCEIQIRTLLQHAFSELTHDLTYKSKTAAQPQVIRVTAKSMALIETADELFIAAKNEYEKAGKEITEKYNYIKQLYKSVIQRDNAVDKYNLIVLDALSDYLKTITLNEIDKYLNNNQYIPGQIKAKYDHSFIHRQPIVLLLYYMIPVKAHELRSLWPFPDSDLEPVFADLGKSMN